MPNTVSSTPASRPVACQFLSWYLTNNNRKTSSPSASWATTAWGPAAQLLCTSLVGTPPCSQRLLRKKTQKTSSFPHLQFSSGLYQHRSFLGLHCSSQSYMLFAKLPFFWVRLKLRSVILSVFTLPTHSILSVTPAPAGRSLRYLPFTPAVTLTAQN